MTTTVEDTRKQSIQLLEQWLDSCTRRGGKISRNTFVVGIVILDRLRKQCPLSQSDIASSGGEIKHSRSKRELPRIYAMYGLPDNYLKEVTTRQSPQDGHRLLELFEWGGILMVLKADDRDQLLVGLIEFLVERAKEWLNREKLKVDLDRTQSPVSWIRLILGQAEGRSGGIVEQHLVGAKLAKRYPETPIPNHPAHAADAQTQRKGDFEVFRTIYHVTGSPTPGVIEKCIANLRAGLHPVLLVPEKTKQRAHVYAEDEIEAASITIVSIEDFVALNIIEMTTREQDFFGVLQDIVATYNQRLTEVETDLSLQIEMR